VVVKWLISRVLKVRMCVRMVLKGGWRFCRRVVWIWLLWFKGVGRVVSWFSVWKRSLK